MIVIDKTTYRASSFNERVRFLVLHYTAGDFESSVKSLIGPNVSVQYLVSDTNPDHIFQLIDESERAWHAGVSSWQGRDNLNDTSIGIEIVNLGFIADKAGKVTWYPYPQPQIDSVISLSQNIISRYNIHPTCVVGHSDIAPGRKEDPGPLFPWKQLYDNGIGAWYDDTTVISMVPSMNLSDIQSIQEKFLHYGYKIEPTGIIDPQTKDVIISFQMHFRPHDFSGVLDAETVAILEALIKKYRL